MSILRLIRYVIRVRLILFHFLVDVAVVFECGQKFNEFKNAQTIKKKKQKRENKKNGI